MHIRNGKNYFLWLLELIKIRDVNTDEYSMLLEQLFNTEFTWTIAHDSNRATDGLNLRYEFARTYNGGGAPCSVLEVLIALARNWEHEITYDFKLGDRSALWFWVMLENLGLLDYTNDAYDEEIIGEKLVIWLKRKFTRNGYGSPFPVKSGGRDQRTIEMWLQLQDFVLENVEI